MIIARTPLRVSFVGGGSDMKSYYSKKRGAVVCSAIDKFVYAIVKERFDDMIYINYSKKECVENIDEIRHDLVREAMKITGIKRGIEVTTLADIPSTGSGLGSSSSITVALLHAFYTYKNRLVTARKLAEDACRIEIDILKKPIGKQDQFAAAYGGINRFVFEKDGRTTRFPVSVNGTVLRRFSSELMLYYTGIGRQADSILKEQEKNLSSDLHFTTMERMVSLVEPFIDAVCKGDMPACGRLLNENWELKKNMASRISNNRIEEMFSTAKKAGARAGKITGAGGGGFLLLMVPAEKKAPVMEAMKEFRELPFMLEPGGSKIIFDYRTYSSK